MQIKSLNRVISSGFALPAVLIIATGVMILLLTLMTVVGLERSSSKARLGSYQADLAVESGLEEAKMILSGVASSDTYVVASIPFAVEFDDDGDGVISAVEDDELDVSAGERGRPYLFAIQGGVENGTASFRYTPLFASHLAPSSSAVSTDGTITVPGGPGVDVASTSNLDSKIALRGPSHLQPPATAWRVVEDEDGVPVARYSYWIEDLQGYLDAEFVPGNSRSGGHARANEVWQNRGNWNPELQQTLSDYIGGGGVIPLWPAPGINPDYVEQAVGFSNPDNRLLAEAAVYLIDENVNSTGLEDRSRLDDVLRTISPNALTPGSLLALNGAEAPIERVPDGVDRGRIQLSRAEGEIEDRWVEENFITGNRAWDEQALVPFVPGISPQAMGIPRLNLNFWLRNASRPESAGFGLVPGLASRSEEAVTEFSNFVQNALPEFASERRGGFGNWMPGSSRDRSYLATIAACAIDYADLNTTPTVVNGQFRGIDSHPLISEYLITHRQVGFENESGANFMVVTVETFAELWNMSNQPLSGTFELGYENPYVFEALGNPEVEFMGPLERTLPSGTQSWSSHTLQRSAEDGEWYSRPQVINLPANGYTLVSTGPITYHLLVSPTGDFLPLPVELNVNENVEVPNFRLRWNGVLCDRSGGGLELTTIILDLREQVTRAVIPGTWGEFNNFYTGMFDVRQSWWAGLSNPEGVVSENSYPQNYTPGRRTVRYGSIARFNEDALHGRLLVSEWPDGGHDDDFGVADFHQQTNTDASRQLSPDATSLYTGDTSDPSTAPQFISNLGRFVSETELGNIYDPHMWQISGEPPSRTAEIWYHESRNEAQNAEVAEVEEGARIATVVGGGNTLRIGRPEHEAFDRVGLRASALLDLFHCGQPLSFVEDNRVGGLRKIEGHVNINTAPRDVIRALVGGYLVSDPEISRIANSFDTNRRFAPRTSDRFKEVSTTDAFSGSTGIGDEAAAIADAIIAGRPFVSRSQLADLRYPDDFELEEDLRGKPVFGNKFNHAEGVRLQLSDRASEEAFARVYNSTTIRSRNFRVHVIGEALEQTPSGNLRVKATRKKSYRLFVDPGERDQLGTLGRENVSVETLYETNL